MRQILAHIAAGWRNGQVRWPTAIGLALSLIMVLWPKPEVLRICGGIMAVLASYGFSVAANSGPAAASVLLIRSGARPEPDALPDPQPKPTNQVNEQIQIH